MKKSILALVAVLCIENAFAQSQPLTTQSISIFKNGQAFYIKNGTLKPTNGKFLLPDPAPQALYGTLWFNSPDGSLSRVASYPDTLREQKTEAAVVVWDLLRNNIGKTIGGVLDEKNSVTGKIISVSPMRKDERGEPIYGPESLVTLQTQQGNWTTISAGQIRYINFQEQPNLEVSMPKITPRNLIELSFNNKKGEQPFDMMYLANGLDWAPEYLLELTGENTGTLSLQAEIANNSEDIINTNLNLVVGVPNFAFANRLSYLVDFLNKFQVPIQSNYGVDLNIRGSRSQASNYYIDGVRVSDNLPPSQTYDSEEIEGSSNEDLFFYTLKNFSLPKGGRSIQPIFEENVEVAHIYECQLPSNDGNRQQWEQDFLFTPQDNKVFHTIRLNNKSKQPWTTAPIFILNTQGSKGASESRPVSQDQLTYTPPGSINHVKLTNAIEVKVEQAERELSRVQGLWTWHGTRYDLVQVEAKIKVKNFKDKQLDLRIQRDITGNLKKSSIDWQKNEIIHPEMPRNRQANVIWETPIKANSELEIVYTYEIYVPSY